MSMNLTSAVVQSFNEELEKIGNWRRKISDAVAKIRSTPHPDVGDVLPRFSRALDHLHAPVAPWLWLRHETARGRQRAAEEAASATKQQLAKATEEFAARSKAQRDKAVIAGAVGAPLAVSTGYLIGARRKKEKTAEAFHQELDKIALGIGVSLGRFGEREQHSVDIGLPYGVAVSSSVTPRSGSRVQPTVGLSPFGPTVGVRFQGKRDRGERLSKREGAATGAIAGAGLGAVAATRANRKKTTDAMGQLFDRYTKRRMDNAEQRVSEEMLNRLRIDPKTNLVGAPSMAAEDAGYTALARRLKGIARARHNRAMVLGGLAGGIPMAAVGALLAKGKIKATEDQPGEKTAGMSFLDQDRPEGAKKIYRALKRDHPEMSAEMKARIAARHGKPGKQHRGPPYAAPIKDKLREGEKTAEKGGFSKTYGDPFSGEDEKKIDALWQRVYAATGSKATADDAAMKLEDEIYKEKAPPTNWKKLLGNLGLLTAGGFAGYASGRHAPLLMKLVRKTPVPPSERVRSVAGMAGMGLGMAAPLVIREQMRHDAQKKPSRKPGAARAVQPSDGGLGQRHEGHSAEVPSGLLRADAARAGDVPSPAWKSDKPRVHDRREGDRADRYRSGELEYRYGGKAPRDYSFTGPVRVR